MSWSARSWSAGRGRRGRGRRGRCRRGRCRPLPVGERQRLADQGREGVRVGEVGPVGRAVDLDQYGTGRVLHQPVHRLPMPEGRVLASGRTTAGRSSPSRRREPRRRGWRRARRPGRARRPAAPPCPSRGAGPRPSHRPSAGRSARPPGRGARSDRRPPASRLSRRPGRPQVRATASAVRRRRRHGWMRRSRHASAAAEGDVAAVAVSDDDGGPSVDDRQQVVDVPVERGVDGERLTRTVVAPAVVDDGVEVVEPAQYPGETGDPVERPVDEHDDAGRSGQTFREVLGDGELVGEGIPDSAWQVPPGGAICRPDVDERDRPPRRRPAPGAREPPRIRGVLPENAHIAPPDRALLVASI